MPLSVTRRACSARLAFCFLFALLTAGTAHLSGASPDVVISQVYGGGGNANAPYQNDFVELFNRSGSAVSLNGLSVQYASATGTGSFASAGALSGTLAAGQHYLVRLAGGAVGAPLPAADSTGSLNLSGTTGKVALVRGTTTLGCNGGSLPCNPTQLAQIIDLVGYGGANFFEGSSPAPAAANSLAVFRKFGGCIETDQNGADFETGSPNPRNTSVAPTSCSDLPPVITSSSPLPAQPGLAVSANIALTFSEPVTADPAAFQLSCSTTGAHSFTLTGGPSAYLLNPNEDFAVAEACTVTVSASGIVDQDEPVATMTADFTLTFSTTEACGDPSTPISSIQGSGAVSPRVGTSNAIEGIVVGDYQGAGQFGGYYVQEEDADSDGDPLTSEGLFIFHTATPVSLGDKVRVRGTVLEFLSSGTPLTELSPVATAQVCSSGHPLPSPSTMALPVPAADAWEPFEGMRISIPGTLTVTETFTLARFGELVLSSGGRLAQPTNVVSPGAPANALQDLNNRNRIVLDDANNEQNLDPTRYPTGGLRANNTVRVGDAVTEVNGILEQRFGVYRLQPADGAAGVLTPAVLPNNTRPDVPSVGGTIQVASFNVLNYFNGDGRGGGFPTARGASTAEEFARQRAKTIAAMVAMDADIIGLMELENDAPGSSAVEDLVAGLNDATAAGSYAFIDTGVIGTDEIRVGLLYKPSVVVPFHQHAVIDSSVDPEFIDTLNRPSLAQTFTQLSNGKRLTVVVNHLKSKGSDCNGVGDVDRNDGQGNCNVTRTRAAQALVQWLATDPTSSGDADVLVIGDMNSYAMEDPITAMRQGGFVDLIQARIGAAAYSYVFEGQSGYLDHALASRSLAPRVTGVAEWHINADEPIALDYNLEFKSIGQRDTFYAADPFRSSDHDPVIVGINLIQPFSFTGFFSPVSAVNTVNAGRAIPLKFSLGGNRGLDIFLADSPASRQVPCGVTGAAGTATPTSTAEPLSYELMNDRYQYTWKTDRQWAGTCRELLVGFADGTTQTALFRFVK